MLQNALNESAGYNKYKVFASTDENLLTRIHEAVGNGSNQMRPCDTCAEYMEEYIRYANGEEFTN